MKNILIGIGIGVVGTIASIALTGYIRFNFTNGGDILPPQEEPRSPSLMSESEARALAEASCIKGGEALGAGSYNPNSKTWWFDANLNATQPGCNPACVVFEETRTTEINWRCTGLVPPQEDPATPPPPIANPPATANPLIGTWVLLSGTQLNGTPFMPARPEVFTLTFGTDASVSIGTDCNSMGGGFEVSGSSLTFGNLFSTLMYCEGSSEGEFSQLLSAVTSYQLTEEETLILEQTGSALNLTFRRQ